MANLLHRTKMDALSDLKTDFESGNDIDLQVVHKLTRHLSTISDPRTLFAQGEEDEFYRSLISYLANPNFYAQDLATQESVLKLFDTLLEHYNYEQFTSNIVSLPEVMSAIEQTNNSLIFASLAALLVKASPVDILANTGLVKILVSKLDSEKVSISIVNRIELLLHTLSRGELIRRRLLSKEVLSVLFKIQTEGKIEIMVRLFDLIKTVYLDFVSFGELPLKLFALDGQRLKQEDDVMYPVSHINFYNGVLDCIWERQLTWLLPELQFDAIIDLLFDEEYVYKSFVVNEIMIMLGKLSRFESAFREIDSRYKIIDKITNDYFYDANSVQLLSLINPAVVLYRDQFFTDLRLSSKTVPIYTNFISHEQAFHRSPLVTADLKKLPSVHETYLVLEALSSYRWSAVFLLTNLPLMMNLLLDSPISNPELLQIKRQTLTNLFLYSDEPSFHVWDGRIRAELSRLINGTTQAPQVTVHDNVS